MMGDFRPGSKDTSYESNFSNFASTADDKQKLANMQVNEDLTAVGQL